jgi:hypothetical protein
MPLCGLIKMLRLDGMCEAEIEISLCAVWTLSATDLLPPIYILYLKKINAYDDLSHAQIERVKT